MLPACLRSRFLRSTDRNRMILPTMELMDSRQEMEFAPACPGSGRGAVDLFTFLSREAEKTLRRSAGLSVPQSAYYGSRLASPCPGTGPLRRCSLPAPLGAHSGPAVKPSPSSRRKKPRRGAPSCSAGEEVVSLPADVRSAASKPASSPATAPSPRLAAPPPMPSSFTLARCSEATPEELEEQLRFFARQIKTFRKTSLMYSSPELMERIRQMEEDYGTAVRQFYCCPHPSTPGLEGAAAAAEQSTPGLQGAAAAAEQSTPGLQGAAAAAEQSTPGHQGAAAAAAEQSTPGHQGAAAAAAVQSTPGHQGAAAAAAEQSTPGLQPAVELSEGPEGGLPPLPGPEHLLSFLWGVLTELKPDTQPDTPQPVSARSDTPQPVSARSDTPQPVSARPDTPQPVSARPDTPQPVSARPDTPQPVSARPDTPQPVSARPDTPQPVSARPDTPQPVSARPDTPQPVSARPDTPQPDLKSASTSSTCRRGRRKRDASVHATGGLCDASAPAHVTEGTGAASAPAHATEGLCDASAPAHATEGLCDASAPAHATEGPADASAPSFQGSSGKLVLVLSSATRGSRRKHRRILSLGTSRNSLSSFWLLNPEMRVRQALLRPLRVRQALPLRVSQAFLVARLNSVPARDDLPVARLNSVPARDDLPVARLNSVPVSGPPAMAPSAHPAWVVFCPPGFHSIYTHLFC
ncbi:hypothetical protein CRENBAI_003687 [Crenichthys baileyi]|uniref:Uncharacterized protein n=1 Tax=Crenichthys baileyi TaxID=28760 RepID=A0AAV9QYW3_9TELE